MRGSVRPRDDRVGRRPSSPRWRCVPLRSAPAGDGNHRVAKRAQQVSIERPEEFRTGSRSRFPRLDPSRQWHHGPASCACRLERLPAFLVLARRLSMKRQRMACPQSPFLERGQPSSHSSRFDMRRRKDRLPFRHRHQECPPARCKDQELFACPSSSKKASSVPTTSAF